MHTLHLHAMILPWKEKPVEIHITKLTILKGFSRKQYIHNVIQSSHGSSSITFLSPQTKTPYPLNSNFHSLLPPQQSTSLLFFSWLHQFWVFHVMESYRIWSFLSDLFSLGTFQGSSSPQYISVFLTWFFSSIYCKCGQGSVLKV